jgi:hypothetical protein
MHQDRKDELLFCNITCYWGKCDIPKGSQFERVVLGDVDGVSYLTKSLNQVPYREDDKCIYQRFHYLIPPSPFALLCLYQRFSYCLKHIPQNRLSCWAHGALSSFADRIKIARKGQGVDINLSIQFI